MSSSMSILAQSSFPTSSLMPRGISPAPWRPKLTHTLHWLHHQGGRRQPATAHPATLFFWRTPGGWAPPPSSASSFPSDLAGARQPSMERRLMFLVHQHALQPAARRRFGRMI
jgi:hypothetical protein